MNDTPASPSLLTHLDSHGHAHMVDVSDKPDTRRLLRTSGGRSDSYQAEVAP